MTKEIQKHLDDFGLEQEFGTYGKISGLSGGQKVKLVLASAMWNCPHLLVLDEVRRLPMYPPVFTVRVLSAADALSRARVCCSPPTSWTVRRSARLPRPSRSSG